LPLIAIILAFSSSMNSQTYAFSLSSPASPELKALLESAQASSNSNQSPLDLIQGPKLFQLSPAGVNMLEKLKSDIDQAKATFPLPQDLCSQIHSAIIYTALDTATFSRLLATSKTERRLYLADYEKYPYIVLDQSKSFQLFTNLLLTFVFQKLGLDPREYFKSLGFYLGKGLTQFETQAKPSLFSKQLEFFLENKEQLSLESPKLKEALTLYCDYLQGTLPICQKPIKIPVLTSAEMTAINKQKLESTIRNSMFGDSLFIATGVEFSQLSICVESRCGFTKN
jgi:hypothetical protein